MKLEPATTSRFLHPLFSTASRMRTIFSAVFVVLLANVAMAVITRPPICPLGEDACTVKTTTFLGKPTTITDCGPCSTPTGPVS